MGNLEPDSSSAWIVGCATPGALGHVSHVWSVVAVRPCSPVQRDRRTSGCRSAQRGGRGSTAQIAIALKINRLNILDRAIAWYLADDSLRGRVVVGISIPEVGV